MKDIDDGRNVPKADPRRTWRDELVKEREALTIEITQEVRAALDRAAVAGEAARFVIEQLLPQAERSAALARTAYESGNLTSIAVLESQRAALLARSARIDVLLEAAQARVDLERSATAPFEALLSGHGTSGTPIDEDQEL